MTIDTRIVKGCCINNIVNNMEFAVYILVKVNAIRTCYIAY